MNLEQKLTDAASWISARTAVKPQVLIILGSGLGGVSSLVSVEKRCSFYDVPHFEESTVEHMEGALLFGTIGGNPVMVMNGRFHLYEGFSASDVAFPVQLARKLGVTVLITTSAAGAANPMLSAGDIMVNIDHLNLTGTSPLIGDECLMFGSRYIDQNHIYNTELRELVKEAANEINVPLKVGIYAQIVGPEKETPAELRMIRSFGADAVGMSSVIETIAAAQCGMQVVALSRITDMHGVRVEDNEKMMSKLIEKVVEKLCVKAISNR